LLLWPNMVWHVKLKIILRTRFHLLWSSNSFQFGLRVFLLTYFSIRIYSLELGILCFWNILLLQMWKRIFFFFYLMIFSVWMLLFKVELVCSIWRTKLNFFLYFGIHSKDYILLHVNWEAVLNLFLFILHLKFYF
jgi:hypothetical protein